MGSPLRLEAGPIPLYYQLEQDLRVRIQSSEFGPGSMLPTEDQICGQYGVSRITVRRALDALLQEGLIMRRRGVGSFVAEERHGVNSRLTGSLSEFLASASALQTRWLSLAPAAPPAEVRKVFALDRGDRATRLESLGSLQGEPVAHLEIWFPLDIGEQLDLSDMAMALPVARVVERKLGFRMVRADQLVEADTAGDLAGRHLGIDEETPILKVRRTYYAGQDRPVELAFVRYHPDRYRYAIDFR